MAKDRCGAEKRTWITTSSDATLRMLRFPAFVGVDTRFRERKVDEEMYVRERSSCGFGVGKDWWEGCYVILA